MPPHVAASLSTLEFFDSVLTMNPQVAVFDCDGTLWSGDAGSGFMRWTIETGLLAPDRVAWLDSRYALYLAGDLSEAGICGEMVQVYAGHTEAEMRAAAQTFFASHIQPHIFAEMRELVERLQTAGTEIWAVSSTCDWMIEEGVRSFNIAPARVLAARVRSAAGVVTDELLDVPTDEGKVRALRAAGVLAPDAVFGNSVHDAAMLAMARQAYPVNPTPALVEHSLREGWRIFLPQSIRER